MTKRKADVLNVMETSDTRIPAMLATAETTPRPIAKSRRSPVEKPELIIYPSSTGKITLVVVVD
ncbi:hypothetical protein PNP85_15090, partial [Halobacterium salinarum]|uniref:hypothetical protein n=1 Tax=Halobacterium salinarum TaxID=2242 RepID=UPI00255273C4